MKLLVVDDEIAALHTFLEHVVDETGIEYKMFQNDQLAAVKYAESNFVEAAFLDINMPQINGVSLAEKLIEINKKIKIVFITGYAQDENDISERIGVNLHGYCYKPYDAETLLAQIRSLCSGDGAKISIRTFGAFEILVNGKPVKFSSTKSKELLALLVNKNGAFLSMNEAIAYMWPDKNTEFSKRLYRDAVCRLRLVLKENGIFPLVGFMRAQIVINKDAAECDLWEVLDGKRSYIADFMYMPQYDWGTDQQSIIESLINKRK